MIFISLDPDAPPLREFLGDFAFYLDYCTKQSPSGIELRGPQRWRVKANWKIGAKNFVGDMYHTPQTHTSVVKIGLFREPKADERKDGCGYAETLPGAGCSPPSPACCRAGDERSAQAEPRSRWRRLGDGSWRIRSSRAPCSQPQPREIRRPAGP